MRLRGRRLRLAVLAVALAFSPTFARTRIETAVPICHIPMLDDSPALRVGGVTVAESLPPLPTLAQLVRAGRHWRLETPRGAVHVWVPDGYAPKTAATIVFVHGYWIDVDAAWVQHRLPEQFALSGLNAMFIAPEAPRTKLDPLPWPSLNALLATIKPQVDVSMPDGTLVVAGHSGAYRTLVMWLANERVQTVVMLDAAYGEFDRFQAWVRAATGHRLINIADDTRTLSESLHAALPSTRRIEGLPQGDALTAARDARVLLIRTDIGHYPLVTGGVALPVALRALRVEDVPDAELGLPFGFPLSP